MRKAASPRVARPSVEAVSPARIHHSGRQPHLLVADLQKLGFSDYESRAYIALLGSNPATAYEISKVAGLPRANTYAALESCTEKGAVQPISESPVRYVPVEPAEMLARIARDTAARCERLASQLQKTQSQDGREFVLNIDGEEQVSAKITEMVRAAKVHVWIKAHEDVINAHRADLRAAAARGVRILIILFGSDGRRFQFNKSVRIFLHEGNGVRIGNADNLFTITTDFTTALTAQMYGGVHAAYTRNQAIVTMAESLIRHDMYLAEIFERFGPQIDKAFGPYLQSLRRNYFSPAQVRAMDEMLALVAPARRASRA